MLLLLYNVLCLMSVMRHRSLGQTLAESVKYLFLMFSETLRWKFGFGASQVNLQPLVRKTLMKMIRHLISYREKQQEKERKETFWLIDNTCLTQTNQTSCPPAGNHQQRSFVLKILGLFPFAEKGKTAPQPVLRALISSVRCPRHLLTSEPEHSLTRVYFPSSLRV